MTDSGNTHAFELLIALAIFNARDDLLIIHRRPVDTDEIAVGIVARLFPMPHQTTVGAIGTVAFRVDGQEIEAVGAGGYSRPTPVQSPRPWRAARLRVNASSGLI